MVEGKANTERFITCSDRKYVEIISDFHVAFLKYLCVCLLCMLQCYSAGVPGGAAEELGGHAGADAGREGLPGDWVSAGEGQ